MPQSIQSHGTKRRAEDGLESEQRLSKRFDLLNLDRDGKQWVPATSKLPAVQKPASHREAHDLMHVDDSKDRVYIHNLDEELADLSEDESKMVFLPDIEKQLSRIPQHVLTGERSTHPGTELVLYTVPSSLSVPMEQDSVRKAIIETRARARAKTARDTGVLSRDALLHDDMHVELTGGPADALLDDSYDQMDIED